MDHTSTPNATTGMTDADMRDLWAYLRTLPANAQPSRKHDVGFPYNIRFAVTFWKWLFFTPGPFTPDPKATPAVNRGAYLTTALGHCGECHSPRDQFGGLDRTGWLGGAPDPEGKGRIPNITPGKLAWSAAEIADYLKTGFTPDYDSVGGTMVEVQANMAELSDSDRAAIAAYLKAVPTVKP